MAQPEKRWAGIRNKMNLEELYLQLKKEVCLAHYLNNWKELVIHVGEEFFVWLIAKGEKDVIQCDISPFKIYFGVDELIRDSSLKENGYKIEPLL